MKYSSCTPRRLREFRIDDALPEEPVADECGVDASLPVESIGRIRRFEEDQSQLQRIGTDFVADLLLIDVNFDRDDTDPFVRFGRRPVGLLYGLCFLVAGKTARRPFGYAFHTADPGIWQGKEIDPAMQRLTTLLVAISDAVTSQAGSLTPYRAGDIGRAITWLSRRPADDIAVTASSATVRTPREPHEARLLAADRFRRHLQAMADPKNIGTSRLVVDPTNHVRLLAACEQLGQLPTGTPVNGHQLLRSLGVLVFVDGEADCFAVDGLFPSVEKGLLAEDFRFSQGRAQRGAQKARGTTGLAQNPPRPTWQYEGVTDQRPLVAEFLQSLGHWHDVYQAAKKAAKDFGSGEGFKESENEDGPRQGRIRRHNGTSGGQKTYKRQKSLLYTLIADGDHATVTRFVALAFGIVNQYRQAWKPWCDKWTTDEWIPWGLREEDVTPQKSLRWWLNNLLAVIHELAEDDNGRADEYDVARVLVTERSWKHVWADWRIGSEDILNGPMVKQYLCQAVTAMSGQASQANTKGAVRKHPADTVLLKVGKRIAALKPKQKSVLKESVEGDELNSELVKLLNLIVNDGSLSSNGDDEEAARRLTSRRCLEQKMNGGLSQTSLLSDWVHHHLGLLQGIRFVDERRDDGGHFWLPGEASVGELPVSPPPQPKHFRPSWLSETSLAWSAGISDYTHQIGERIEEKLRIPSGTLGKMANGDPNAPCWLIPLCVQYARDIGFTDKNGWPEFMRLGE